MPFPPSFTNAWDNTFPPDTQAANQLGLDLRTFRTDAQQRFSLLSGTLANRPANMDATFGGAGYGIIFIATDTGQIFQWNGAAWVDVSPTMLGGKQVNSTPVVTNASNADGVLVTIPAASLVAGSVVDITLSFQHSNIAGATVGIFFGATQLELFGSQNTTSDFYAILRVIVTGAATQTGLLHMMTVTSPGGIPTTVPVGDLITATEAIANPIIVKTRQTVAGGGSGPVTHRFISAVWR